MTTNRKPMAGRGQMDYGSKLDSYNKTSKSAAVGTYMRTFARTKTGTMVTTWDDADYAILFNNYLYILADTTGNVDSETTISAQLENILDAVWELYYKNANLKDLVADDEAAWKLYVGAYFFIKVGIQVQYNFRCYLPAYTEADGTPGGLAQIPYFSQDSFDVFVSSMKEYPVPGGIDHLVDLFCGWIIEYTQPYEKNTVRIPGCYVFPMNHPYDLEDLQAARELMRVNWGGFETHAKKFGLKTSTWSDPKKPVVKTINDVDCIAYFNHVWLYAYDDGAVGAQWIAPNGGYAGGNLTTDYTSTEFCFKDTPNESELHVLAPWFGTYNATNNPYGGLVKQLITATENYVNVLHCAQHGTAFAALTLTYDASIAIANMCKGFWDCNAAAFQIFVNGTNFDGDADNMIGGIGGWPLSIANRLFVGSSRGAVETNNDILNYLGRLMT